MTQKITVSLPSQTAHYDIEVGYGLLYDKNILFQSISKLANRFAVITDHSIASLYAPLVIDHLSSKGLEVHIFSFPPGESYKTRATKEEIENQLFEKGLGRDTCIIALGGGVVTDLAGYIAATYCRGLPLVMIPTSLLGMVDACIGGKNGVNVPYGKNMLGCIYQPKKIFIDPSTLQSLPIEEVRNGFVEMIKHGLIYDKSYFEFLEANARPLLALDLSLMHKAIYESCLIKKSIIEEDERDTGKRNLLNFGHTIGHAIELAAQYSISHGEAVAIGILTESYLATHLGHFSPSQLDRIHSIMTAYSLPLKLPQGLTTISLLNAMKLDKKSIKGKPRCVMLTNIGSSHSCDGAYCLPIEEKHLEYALNWMTHDLHRYQRSLV